MEFTGLYDTLLIVTTKVDTSVLYYTIDPYFA